MRKLKNHVKKWRDWSAYAHYCGRIYKILVLIGLKHDDRFENWRYYGNK